MNSVITDNTTVSNKLPNQTFTSNSGASKPTLIKTTALDVQDEEVKKLSRGISHTAENASIITRVRNELCASLAENDEYSSYGNQVNALETHDCTFTLPDLSAQSDEFRVYLENDLIDSSMLISLQEAMRLNWWTCLGEGCEKLWPLSTTGDGNCLLHAASLGMWGFHDRLLTLRKALHTFLTSGSSRHALWRRWRWQTALYNVQAGLGLFLNEDEWRHEWDNILKLASSQPRTSGSSTPCVSDTEIDGTTGTNGSKTYESLEEIHVLALAHVLKRPIIVVADTVLKDVNGEALAPISFGGIYLPLEIPAGECSRSPLVLAYDAAHFSALVAMKKDKEQANEAPAVLPLIDVDRDLLPIQFEVDPGETCVWNRDELNQFIVQRTALTHEDRLALLNQYLDLVDVPCPAVVKSTSGNNNNNKSKAKTDSKANRITSRLNNDVDDWNSDGEFNSQRLNHPHAVKAPKQLHNVAKQFGSLSRSMGRKLKKNLIENFTTKHPPATQTRLNNGQWECPEFILCARLHTEKQHPCLEQMINNYLQSARQRFEQQQEEKQRQTLVWQRRKQQTLAEMALQEGPSPCINPDCTMYGTALTSYMCTACYAKQLEQEEERMKNVKVNKVNQNAMYGAGKSVFYAHSESNDYAELANIPSRKPPTSHQQNGTLYLSNSTFFNDVSKNAEGHKNQIDKTSNTYDKLINDCDCVGTKDSVESERATNIGMKLVDRRNELRNELSVEGNKYQSMDQLDLKLSESLRIKPIDHTPFQVEQPAIKEISSQPTYSHYATIRKPCKANGCPFYGESGYNWFCSDCFQQRKAGESARLSILEEMHAKQLQ